MKTVMVMPLVVTAALPLRFVAPQQFNPAIKCQQRDADGTLVVTRLGSGELGWNHFSDRRNIKKCGVVNSVISGKPDKKMGAHVEYWGTHFSKVPAPSRSISSSSRSRRSVRMTGASR